METGTGPVTVNRVEIDQARGRAVLFDSTNQPVVFKALTLTGQYEREKGPAVTFRVPIEPSPSIPLNWGSALEQFNRFYIVDTAWFDDGRGRHAATAVMTGRRPDAGLPVIALEFVGAFEFLTVNPAINP